VRAYEQLLREAEVGVALEPEWRMGPGQVPGREIGSVGAAEVQAVADWLSALVADAGLPDKLFVVHQFHASMVRERDLRGAARRPAVRGRVHVAFFDEDPRLMAPDDVLALAPAPELVTHQ
jgi:hypothetical protein